MAPAQQATLAGSAPRRPAAHRDHVPMTPPGLMAVNQGMVIFGTLGPPTPHDEKKIS